MKITNPITLDVARSNSYICLLGKQFDANSRYLQVTLTNNGQPLPIPSGAGVVLRATRADGVGSMTAGTVNGDGTALVEIDETVLEVAGAASLSIEVTSGGQVLTSASCNLTVQKADASGWVKVYVAAASVSAGTYYITIAGQSYSFTTTQTIPAGGAIYFNTDGGTAQTRDASGNVLDASLTLTAGTSGTELTSDVPTMSFLTAIAGQVAAIEAELAQKANIDGSYPLLHAGTADDLIADTGATQAIPFIQEGTGKGNGEATVKAGGVLQLKKKIGNTAAVNQLCNYSKLNTGTFSDINMTKSGDTLIANGTASSNAYINLFNPAKIATISGHKYLVVLPSGTAATYYDNSVTRQYNNATSSVIFTGSGVDIAPAARINSGTTVTDLVISISLHDLTLWFGSNDQIPSDLLSHPENWGRYYAGSLDYNAGTLKSADGTVLTSKGADGTSVLAEVDTGSEVLRSAGAAADEKTPDGTITRRVGYVDMGTLSFETATANGKTYSNIISDIRQGSASGYGNFIQSAIFIGVEKASMGLLDDGEMSVDAGGRLQICKTAWANYTSAQIATALSGVYLYYELATPTPEQGTAFAENIPCDPDGTLNWTQSAGVPQGNEIFYPDDLKGALESIVAALPSANGTYTLHATVTTAGVTFSWS